MDLAKRKQKNDSSRTSLSRLIASSIAGIVALAVIIFTTTPDRIGPIGITVFFLLLLSTLVSVGLIFRATFMPKAGSSSLLLVIVASLAATGAVALNTIDIGLGEVILLILFTVTFGIYWAKLRR